MPIGFLLQYRNGKLIKKHNTNLIRAVIHQNKNIHDKDLFYKSFTKSWYRLSISNSNGFESIDLKKVPSTFEIDLLLYSD